MTVCGTLGLQSFNPLGSCPDNAVLTCPDNGVFFQYLKNILIMSDYTEISTNTIIHEQHECSLHVCVFEKTTTFMRG